MCNRTLVIGAGIAGIQAALDIANSGYPVVLVEKEPSIGGRMAQLSETFPTLDCSQCILTPRTVEVGHHDNIRLYTYSQVESVVRDEATGSFNVRIRRRATYVNWDVCTGCGLCQEKCPFKVESIFERGIGQHKVIYTLSPQAVPNKPVIDAGHCRYLQSKWELEAGRVPAVDSKGRPAKPKCGACALLCPADAIEWDQQDTIIEEQVGAIIVATGFDLFAQSRLAEYGGGRIPDVIDGLAFERLLAASGPTEGQIRRPSDGQDLLYGLGEAGNSLQTQSTSGPGLCLLYRYTGRWQRIRGVSEPGAGGKWRILPAGESQQAIPRGWQGAGQRG
jgi:heterodisulfide reductase subunit A